MKPNRPTPSFSSIKIQVPIDTALAHYGITLTGQGKRLVGPCPLHRGANTRAFVVSPDRRAWYCFGDCNRGGSVLDVIMALEDCSVTDAARILAQRHGLSA